MRKLILGSAEERTAALPDGCADMALCDLPYGTTRNRWDSPLDLGWLWRELHRLVKPDGAIVLFGQDKFSARLVLSNEKHHRYNLVWKKGERITGFLNAKRRPLVNHEDVLVFSREQTVYRPQLVDGRRSHGRGRSVGAARRQTNYGDFAEVAVAENLKYPKSVLEFDPVPPGKGKHPTEKPVDLLAYLIRTYTAPGDTVLDLTMGVGSTCVAAAREGRDYIGIEKDETYYRIACDRLALEELLYA